MRITSRYFDQDIYGDKRPFIEGIGFSRWARDYDFGLMELLPLALTWNEWKAAFAKAYPSGKFCGRPRGLAYAWAEVQGTSPCRIQSIVTRRQIQQMHLPLFEEVAA